MANKVKNMYKTSDISIVIQCFSSESILKAIMNPFCSFGASVLI